MIDFSETTISKSIRNEVSDLISKCDSLLQLTTSKVDGSKLGYDDSHYKLVTFEDTGGFDGNWQELFEEIVRIIQDEGRLVVKFNNEASPAYGYEGGTIPFTKFFKAILRDYGYYFGFGKQDNLDLKEGPYILCLANFLRKKGLIVERSITFWQEQKIESATLIKIISFLQKWDVYPFKYWGDEMLIIASKKELNQGIVAGTMRVVTHWLNVLIVGIIVILPFTPILLAGYIVLSKGLSHLIKKIKEKTK